MNIGIMAFENRINHGGGTNAYTIGLVEALAEFGGRHNYFVFVNNTSVDSWGYRSWPSNMRFVPLSVVESKRSIVVRVWRALRRLLGRSVPIHYGEAYVARQIDELELDLLHFPQTIIYPLLVQTPAILTFFDLQHEYYPEFFTYTELGQRDVIYPSSVQKAVCLIVPTEYTRRTLIEKYGVSPRKMELVPVGLDPLFRRSQPEECEEIRDHYNLPREFLFYPANPWTHKNHARLMAALRVYADLFEEVPWLVLTGRHENEKRDAIQLAIAAGVEERVIDLGIVPRSDLPALYSAAKCLIFPSLFEGFGIPLVEAMACGCPILAADATAIPEVVQGAAVLFDPFEPGEIAKAINRIYTDPALRDTLVDRGYQQLERFSWKQIVSQILKVYERAVEV
jgi:glycosyltransferase involved in cell wall biosynthesis